MKFFKKPKVKYSGYAPLKRILKEETVKSKSVIINKFETYKPLK